MTIRRNGLLIGSAPEPQLVYVATWFDVDSNFLLGDWLSNMNAIDPEAALRYRHGFRPGFRIDVIERELP